MESEKPLAFTYWIVPPSDFLVMEKYLAWKINVLGVAGFFFNVFQLAKKNENRRSFECYFLSAPKYYQSFQATFMAIHVSYWLQANEAREFRRLIYRNSLTRQFPFDHVNIWITSIKYNVFEWSGAAKPIVLQTIIQSLKFFPILIWFEHISWMKEVNEFFIDPSLPLISSTSTVFSVGVNFRIS